jgi:hypothetical protein
MSKLEEFKALKVEAEQEILNDTTKTPLDKLRDLYYNDMWGYSDWVNIEFPKWTKECEELERQATIDAGKDPEKEYVCRVTDTVFDPSCFEHGRGETVSYVDIMDDYISDFKYEHEDLVAEYEKTGRIPESVTMTVVTNRGDYESEVIKPVQEVIDRLCEFCIEKKIIGYTNDW